jgi:hypothetical protein
VAKLLYSGDAQVPAGELRTLQTEVGVATAARCESTYEGTAAAARANMQMGDVNGTVISVDAR